ncbi:MAG: hypothetical protein VXZ58_06695, partial [Actinomycetota bacterium]|nr:hypothetical protein [Actinomycetota bacterium]
MSSTFKRAALGTMQEIPLSSSYDGDTSGQITKVSDDVQSPQRGSKMSVGARLNYATGDDYSIDNYKID